MNQKYMLYCLEKKKKMCLPFVIFHYLKELITKSRTTGLREGKKPPMYIPFGRLISDILIESGLVGNLIQAQCTEDLKETTGEVLDARNMKKIGALTDIIVDPEPEDPNEAIRRRIFIDGFPSFTKHDDPEVLAFYIFSLEQEGIDVSQWTYDDFPDCPPDMLAQKKKKSRKRKSEAVGESKQKKKSKKSKKEKVVGLGTYSEPYGKGTSNKPSSDMSTSSTSQIKSSKQIQTPLSVLIPEPIPLNSAPPLKQTQTNSEDILTNQSPTNSADCRMSDPKSPHSHYTSNTH
jgi:hypothetical protein